MPRRTDLVSFLLLAAAASCDGPARSDAPRSREAELARIADHCGLPRSSLRLAAGAELHIRPPPDARYQSIDCLMRELRNSRVVRNLPMGFVGNEAYSTQANGSSALPPPGSATVAAEDGRDHR